VGERARTFLVSFASAVLRTYALLRRPGRLQAGFAGSQNAFWSVDGHGQTDPPTDLSWGMGALYACPMPEASDAARTPTGSFRG